MTVVLRAIYARKTTAPRQLMTRASYGRGCRRRATKPHSTVSSCITRAALAGVFLALVTPRPFGGLWGATSVVVVSMSDGELRRKGF
jgi:hypothetical protein